MTDGPGDGTPPVDEMQYFVAVFTRWSWRTFIQAGGQVAGFRRAALGRMSHLQIGDTLLCYVTDGVGFVGLLRVAGEPFETDDREIWDSDDFPERVPVELLAALPESMAVPMPSLLDALPRVRQADQKQPGSWGNFVRGAPRRWPRDEAAVVVAAISAAVQEAEAG